MTLEIHRPSFALPHNRHGRPPREYNRVKIAYVQNQNPTQMKRSSPTDVQGPTMPVSAGSQSVLATFPSFMSVFGDGTGTQKSPRIDATATTAQSSRNPFTNKRPNNSTQLSSPLPRRDSSSTFESTDSSPTTTISTVESSLTEPSPSSSPESPTSLLPLSSFKYLRTNSVPTHAVMDKEQFSNSFPTLPGLERSDSPNKKMRNMKNLSVNTSASNRQGHPLPKLGASNPIAGSPGHAFSAPPTPSFIVPVKLPRKKPSNLGLLITTPDSATSTSSSQEKPKLIPQTPSDSQIHTLRLLQKSPTGPLFSPTHAPEGGMRLPPLSNTSTSSRFGKSGPPLSVSPHSSLDASLASPITRKTLDHVQEEADYDPPLSQEVKSPAYPQGPVCIYDPSVYLYLEPSHIEAREFDVVLNVAREVQNPFMRALESASKAEPADKDTQVSMNPRDLDLAGREGTQESKFDESTFSARELQHDDANGNIPSTPKATKPQPEYIHVPWDHNTNVVDDLPRLCELIEDRVRQGKRVLVHCQCGVSRSASLVVAYGIYKNQDLTVQEAYDAVKHRSRWIGPNMNLIYQLSEFKSKLSRSLFTGTHAWHSWRALGSGRSNPNATLSTETRQGSSLRAPPQKSLTAPSQLESISARANSYSPPGSAQLVAMSAIGNITPGPSSAPPDMQWSPDNTPAQAAMGDVTPTSQNEPRLLPPPMMMDIDTNFTLSPTDDREAILEKGIPPTRVVASDLQQVANDLDHSEQYVGDLSSKPMDMDMDNTGGVLSSPKNAVFQTNMIDAIARAPPRPLPAGLLPSSKNTVVQANTIDAISRTPPGSLPAGFSSLLTRRQGLQRLPLRQDPPRLAPTQPIAANLNAVLHDDVPQTPSLLSPRAVEFTASPFHRTAAGDLAGSSVFEQGLLSPKAVEEDPRSPHQRGEAPITRNIFDMI